MKYTNVTNPKYASENNDYIECTVNFDDLGTIKFIAYRADIELHSREIYNRIVSGEFGPIEPYAPEVIKLRSTEDIVRDKRNQLLQQLDQLILNPLRFAEYTNEYKNQLADYRRQLLDITDQLGFPDEIIWPEFPEEKASIDLSGISTD
jgi:hypothetical protein